MTHCCLMLCSSLGRSGKVSFQSYRPAYCGDVTAAQIWTLQAVKGRYIHLTSQKGPQALCFIFGQRPWWVTCQILCSSGKKKKIHPSSGALHSSIQSAAIQGAERRFNPPYSQSDTLDRLNYCPHLAAVRFL